MPELILDERYELLQHIGSGGMADVFKAHDLILDRLVAVKILNSQYAGDTEFVSRFNREAKGAAKLSHPNIVGIYDVGEDDGRHFIVMEYVDGITLKKLIEEHGHLSLQESLHIAKKIAAALEMAHSNHLVHCDIKPHNILVTSNGAVKVADFGIARVVSSSTLTYDDTVVGSVHYFSPEQAKGTPVNLKTDIYSLGVVMYEMLTGCLPFNGSTPVSIALKHLQEQPVSVRSFDENIPLNVEQIVSSAMEKDAELRPDSTEIFKEIEAAEKDIVFGKNSKNESDPFATQVIPRIQDIIEENAKEEYEDDDDGNISETVQKLFHSKRFLLIVAVILFFGFMIGAFFSFGKFWSTSEIAVPNVVGKQMTLAKQILEGKNLRVKFVETYDAEIPIGQVVSQYPEANVNVKEQRQVTLYISRGGEEIEMPDLKGMTKAAALERIKKAGLKIGSVNERFSSDDDAGNVILQDPRYRTKITKGQVVDIIISKGAKMSKVRLPDFTGSTFEFAKTNTASLKLQIGNIVRRSSNQPEGIIISQSPTAGTEVNEGTKVYFVVSAGSDRNIGGKTNNDSQKKPPTKDNSDSGKTK